MHSEKKSCHWPSVAVASGAGLMVLLSLFVWLGALLIIEFERGATSIGIIGPTEDPVHIEPMSVGQQILLFVLIPLVIALASSLPPSRLGLPWSKSLLIGALAHLPWWLYAVSWLLRDGSEEFSAPVLFWLLLLSVSAGLNITPALLLQSTIPVRAMATVVLSVAVIAFSALMANSWIQDIALFATVACWPVLTGVAQWLNEVSAD